VGGGGSHDNVIRVAHRDLGVASPSRLNQVLTADAVVDVASARASLQDRPYFPPPPVGAVLAGGSRRRPFPLTGRAGTHFCSSFLECV